MWFKLKDRFPELRDLLHGRLAFNRRFYRHLAGNMQEILSAECVKRIRKGGYPFPHI